MPTETTLSAIDQFIAARPEGYLPKGQWYRPNGGQATWTPSEYINEDTLNEELGRDWETAELSQDGTLELFRHQGPVLSYFACSWAPEASGGRRRIAYFGAHAGFCWEDDAEPSDHLKIAMEHAEWDETALAKLGLACCEDDLCGDDGGYWLIADQNRFDAVLTKCLELDASDEEGDMSGEETFVAIEAAASSFYSD